MSRLVECVNRFAPMTQLQPDVAELPHLEGTPQVSSGPRICAAPPLWGLPLVVLNGVHESKGLTTIQQNHAVVPTFKEAATTHQ